MEEQAKLESGPSGIEKSKLDSKQGKFGFIWQKGVEIKKIRGFCLSS